MTLADHQKGPQLSVLTNRPALYNPDMSRSQPTSTTAVHPTDWWHRTIVIFFHLLVFTVPLFFTWVNEELFEFNKIELVYAYTIIIATLWICRIIHQKRIAIKRTPFDLPIALFLISQIISTIFSMDPHTSVFGYYTRFNGGLLSTISYITLFYAAINNLKKKDLRQLFVTT